MAARYGTDILIGDQEVDEAMERLKQGADKPQFLVSEIYIGVDRPEDEISVRASAEQIVEQIKQGASFQTVAGQFSQSPSAADGGDIGWVVQGQLAEEIDRALSELRPGEIAGRSVPKAAIMSFCCATGASLSERRSTTRPRCGHVDPNAPMPLDRFLIPLPANADEMMKDRAMKLATNIATRCGPAPIFRASEPAPGHGVPAARQHEADEAEPGIAQRADQDRPRRVVKPFFSPAGWN